MYEEEEMNSEWDMLARKNTKLEFCIIVIRFTNL